jgi:predicted translin family RNA/ssDNA-binding protein
LRIVDFTENNSSKREKMAGSIIERATVPYLLFGFYTTGKVFTKLEVRPCNDEEYIASVLSFVQEIPRFVINRACDNDIYSVDISRKLVSDLNGKFLEFDFRNGPLRRKYDGVKYCLRTIEDVAFELSLLNKPDNEVDEPASKLRRISVDTSTSCAFSVFDSVEYDEIRNRMDIADKEREKVIKEARDIQKLAKLGVYAATRENLEDARRKLDQAKVIAVSLLPVVTEHTGLRQGGYSSSLEEWGEGMLLLHWVLGKRIVSKSELEIVNTNEYIGALSDFTGEIGRLAVAHASKRNVDAVFEIQQAQSIIYNAIARVNFGGRFSKKLDAVLLNLKKVETINLELQLLRRSGKANLRFAESSAMTQQIIGGAVSSIQPDAQEEER